MFLDKNLDSRITANFSSIRFRSMLPAVLIMAFCAIYFLSLDNQTGFINNYTQVQKEWFLTTNKFLSHYPILQNNLTQLGDVLIFFPFLSIFVICASKLWEALLNSAMLSLLVCAVLKRLFAMPRPAAVYDQDSFVIIGKTLTGHTSLPSGHSVSVFMILTILMFGFMPKQKAKRILWTMSVIIVGLFVAFSRVAVGAHYPLDVIIGSALGYCIAILGILIYKNACWIAFFRNKYHVFILLGILVLWSSLVVKKAISDHLLIFYLAILALISTGLILIKNHVKKN